MVVPYVGTWIEIHKVNIITNDFWVVPYVGTWIEIQCIRARPRQILVSFPTWERG